MIRNLKILALAGMAVLAMSAVAASAAQAAPTFQCEAYSCYGHGTTTDNVFQVETGKVKCNANEGTTFTATLSAANAVASLAPTYAAGNCLAFGANATIAPEGCSFEVALNVGGTTPFPTTTKVACPAGKKITVTNVGTNCVVTVGEQTGLTGLSLVNEGTGSTRDLKATININGIAYTETGSECAAAGSHANGKYTGTATIKGFHDTGGTKGAQEGLFIA